MRQRADRAEDVAMAYGAKKFRQWVEQLRKPKPRKTRRIEAPKPPETK